MTQNRPVQESSRLELFLLVVALVGVGWAVVAASQYPAWLLTVPVSIWAAYRFGQREADPLRQSHAKLESALDSRTRELQSALERLIASDARFSEAQQLAHVGSWESLPDNTETWSEELFRIYGFEPNSFVPSVNKFLEIVHPDDRAAVSGRRRDALQDDQPFEFEHRIIRPDGAVRTIRAHGRVVVDEQSQVLRRWGTAQDVTAQHWAEETVRRSERRLQTIVDAEPACVKLVSPDGLLLDMNPAGLKMIGAATLTQVVGRPVINLVHPADRSQYLEMHRAASRGTPTRWEFRIIGLTGGERWVDSHMVPFELSGNGHKAPPAVLGVTSDVTERKRLEDQLRQSQKMDALGRLAGGITHDFNNFLTALIGYTELALKQIGDDEAAYPELKHDLREVLKIGSRAAALTRQLLIFSRSPMLEPAPAINFDVVITPLAGMLQQLLGGEIRVQTSFRSQGALVRIDPRHLEQVVVNLAANSRDAMADGGALTIETAVVDLDDAYAAGKPARPSAGSYLQLSVSDTGTGMDEDVKAHLFEPFYTTKAAGEGTGLGLATVYGIVKQSGGYIWVYSEPGHGTTFKLYFPLVAELPPLQMDHRSPEFDDEDYQTILVVDDNEHVRALARDVLRDHGYRVLEARTGEEAHQLVTGYGGAIDLLVTDVVLPGMSGPELVNRLCRSVPALQTLFMSGYGQRAIAHHGVIDPDAILLEKPFTAEQLVTLVRAMLETTGPRTH